MIRFTKMHGIGNDYIYVNGFEETVDEPEKIAPKIADRHFGVGADGLILVLPPEKGVDAHVRMRMFNADGSESEMCGNGIRCVCKLAHDRGISRANPMRVQTGAGVLELRYTLNASSLVDQVTVDMGTPKLALSDIGVDEHMLAWFNEEMHCGAIDIGGMSLVATFVSMGNPHAVFFQHENPRLMNHKLSRFDLRKWGPLVESHSAFVNRINAHFVMVQSRNELTMRTWERGSGITLACGTGAAAVCVAASLNGASDREVLIHLPGGDLKLKWDEQANHVFKTGPATEICTGDWVG